MFISLRQRRKNYNQIKLFLIILAIVVIMIFIFFPRNITSTKKKIITVGFPTETLVPTSPPTPTLIPTLTNIPTPSPTPTLTPIPTNTPTPIPTLTPVPTTLPTVFPTTSFESYFDQYSAQYQANEELLKKIAQCESGMSPSNVNGPYGGLYQFMIQTWQVTRNQMGLDANPDLRFNPEEAIKTAAFKIANGGQIAWKNCL